MNPKVKNYNQKTKYMKKSIVITLLLSLFAVNFSGEAIAASSKNQVQEITNTSRISSKKEIRKEKRFKKITQKLEKKFQKLKHKLAGSWSARDYLTACLVLLLASILLFMLANITIGLFNFLGSFALLGSLVFFVLWLLEYTGNL